MSLILATANLPISTYISIYNLLALEKEYIKSLTLFFICQTKGQGY